MFLVCGEALFDVFVRPEAAGADGRVAMEGVPGGSPFNVAVGLARLGTPTAFLAGLSEDALGRVLIERLVREGVATRYVQRRAERTTLSLVSLREGSPSYSFYGAGAADTSLSVSDLPVLGPEITGLHLGSYTTVVPPVAEALAALALRARSKLVTLDPNVRLGVAPDPAAWRARLRDLLPCVGAFKASDEDLALLWPGRTAAAAATDLLARGPRLVVITQGRDGASAFHHGGRRISVPPPPVTVVDTVGAGDAFQSALIDGLLAAGVRSPDDVAGLSPDAVHALVERCVLAGAITCTRRGADPPRAGELARSA